MPSTAHLVQGHSPSHYRRAVLDLKALMVPYQGSYLYLFHSTSLARLSCSLRSTDGACGACSGGMAVQSSGPRPNILESSSIELTRLAFIRWQSGSASP